MVIVVDNSVILPLFLGDEDSTFAEGILLKAQEGVELIVPALWVLEFGNALLVSERRNRIAPEKIRDAHDAASRLPIEIVSYPCLGDMGVVGDIAQKHQLSFYDSAYLTLALSRKGKMATADKKLRISADNESILYAGET